ncbi:MAG: hypothetical protein ACRCY9_21765, partial [Phycicoccus sp.]
MARASSGGASRSRRGAAPTAATILAAHRDWLAAVDTDGPFLAAPVLRQRWPQGMPRLGDLERGVLAEQLRPVSAAW